MREANFPVRSRHKTDVGSDAAYRGYRKDANVKPQRPADRIPVQASWPDLPRPDLSHYGYGPASEVALHPESYVSEDGRFLVANSGPEARFKAFPGNGVSSLSRVTGEPKFRYFKPTPFGEPLHLKSWVEGGMGPNTCILCELGPIAQIRK